MTEQTVRDQADEIATLREELAVRDNTIAVLRRDAQADRFVAEQLLEQRDALIVERDELRQQVDRVWALLHGARTAARRLTSALIANAHRLDQPFTDDPWSAFVAPAIDDLRRALGMRGQWPTACACDMHGRNCEPPSELCCERCSETQHPAHADGSMCSAPDLSGTRMPTAVEIALRDEVQRLEAELAAVDALDGER